MNCISPVVIKNPDPKIGEMGLIVPCGQCKPCRKAKAREWTVRLLHEQSQARGSLFLTLTYDDENLPKSGYQGTLVKKDLQDFFKRLRFKYTKRLIHHPYLPLRYFGIGEYGDEAFRPHYHVILFGLKWDDLGPIPIFPGAKLFQSDKLREIWTKGNNTVDLANARAIQYVTRYVLKKFNGEIGMLTYDNFGIERPFQLQSLGIGKAFADKYEKDLKESLKCTVNGRVAGLPRYYKERLEIPKEVLYNKAKEAREEALKRLAKKYGVESLHPSFVAEYEKNQRRIRKENCEAVERFQKSSL